MDYPVEDGYVALGHLGGYRPGGDCGCISIPYWEWLIRERCVQTALAVGCGEGQEVEALLKLGVDAWGVDGVPQPHERVITWDYNNGPYEPRADFDLVWSCEFVEHVEEQYIPNFIATFKRGRIVCMTHATPGQGGYHHVNCQDRGYWEYVMGAAGYELDEEATKWGRVLGTGGYFKGTGLAFAKVAA